MDKAGNFIGWLHIDGANLSVLLVEHALSKVHFTAERSSYYKSLLSAEEAAKQKKEKVRVWNWAWLGRRGYHARALTSPLPAPPRYHSLYTTDSGFVIPQLRGTSWCWSGTHMTEGEAASSGFLSPRPTYRAGGPARAESYLEGDLGDMRGMMEGALVTGESSLRQPQPFFGALRAAGRPTAHF